MQTFFTIFTESSQNAFAPVSIARLIDTPASRMTRARETPFHVFLTILSDVVFRTAAHVTDRHCLGNTPSSIEAILVITSWTLVDV